MHAHTTLSEAIAEGDGISVIAVVNVVFSKPMRWALRWAYGSEGRARDRGPSVFRS